MLPLEPYKKFAVITLYLSVAAAVIYLVFNYLWGAILPFLIAYIFAELFKPVVRYSETHSRFPKRTLILGVVLLVAAALATLLYALARQIVGEIIGLSRAVTETLALIQSDEKYAAETFEKINSLVPFIDLSDKLWEMRSNLDEEILSMLVSFGEKISGAVISLLGGAATFFPNALLTAAVIIISTYYFAVDRVKINCFFLSLFPKKIQPLLKKTKDELANTVGRYLRAYGLLFFITFGELLLAFWIMKVKYAFVFALLIAIVDVLPILGTGTVLLPWGIGALIVGNYGRGTGLLITYAVIMVIRQVIEPKIVGKYIGLSPLAALASMYIGLKIMGLSGLILFPLGAIVIKRIVELKLEVEKEIEETEPQT